jgi:hypothetical protein
MYQKKVLLLDDKPVGTFTIDDQGRIEPAITHGKTTMLEMLEYASDQGLVVSIALHPEYGSED